MLIVSKYDAVSLTRGDTARLTVTPTIGEGEEKEPYIVKEDDVLTFTVKKNYGDRFRTGIAAPQLQLSK